MKDKTCKGNYRVDKFDGCGKTSFKFTYGLCPSCLYEWMTTTENGKIHYLKSFAKQVNTKIKKKQKASNKKIIEAAKTLTQLINEAKVPFQKWIRQRDKELPCISCGSYSDLVDGGHFYKAEVYRGKYLLFGENNCHAQCRKCNRYLGGNENKYRLGLIERYGEDFVKALDVIADENRTHDYTREEIKQIKKKYQLKLK
jgi:hypothetical protein